jgi:hypothetical protein
MLNLDNEPISFASPFIKTILQTRIRITTVLMPVARLELILETPILAKIAVNAANRADNNA